MSILSGYKVVELTEVFQGPVAGQVLADYGADDGEGGRAAAEELAEEEAGGTDKDHLSNGDTASAAAAMVVDAEGARFLDEGLGGIYMANRIAALDDPTTTFTVFDRTIW